MSDNSNDSEKPLLCSMTKDGWFHNVNSYWTLYYFTFVAPGMLYYSKKLNSDPDSKDATRLDVTKVLELSIIKDDHSNNNNNGADRGDVLAEGIPVKVTCEQVIGGKRYRRFFRVLLPEDRINKFCENLKTITPLGHTVDTFLESIAEERKFYRDAAQKEKEKRAKSFIPVTSVFRRYIGMKRTLNRLEKKSTYKSIKDRRVVFNWLPIFFNLNDLVHGSWWYVLGSLWVTIVAIVILMNDFTHDIGDDDSTLPQLQYRASWGLMVASGLFFTIGSLAFVRATNEPAIPPMFTYRHFATDELFGAWMFFWAVLPAIPYSLIFLSVDDNIIYLGMLGVSVIGTLGCLLIVVACYPASLGPGDEEQQAGHGEQQTAYLLSCLTCCNKVKCTKFFETHLVNDWLAGCWIIFWSTAIGTFGFIILTIAKFPESNKINNFINVTSVFDCLLFMVGSFYFVAGSYPPQHDHEEYLEENRDETKPLTASVDKSPATNGATTPISRESIPHAHDALAHSPAERSPLIAQASTPQPAPAAPFPKPSSASSSVTTRSNYDAWKVPKPPSQEGDGSPRSSTHTGPSTGPPTGPSGEDYNPFAHDDDTASQKAPAASTPPVPPPKPTSPPAPPVAVPVSETTPFVSEEKNPIMDDTDGSEMKSTDAVIVPVKPPKPALTPAEEAAVSGRP